MIPESAIIEWSNSVPWKSNAQIEQDLVLCRAYYPTIMNTPITKPCLTGAIKSALLGVAVGDALGVPAEFRPREFLKENPVTDMMGHGTHHQPTGSFSDDSSLTFCLAEALTEGFDLHTIGRNFVRWRDEGFWTARGFVFDIGGTTGSYREAVLKAVNLGEDTDTTAAVTGGLAGLLYGWNSIPGHWLLQLARRNDIEELAGRMAARITS